MKIKCLLLDTDLTSVNLLTNQLRENYAFELNHILSNILEAKDILLKNNIDLVFINIDLGFINAFEFLTTLKQKPQVVFICTSEEFAYQAIESDAIDYLLKPLDANRLSFCLYKCIRRFKSIREDDDENGNETLVVKHEGKTIKISLNKIAYIKAFGDYLRIYTANFDSYLILKTMKDIEKILPADIFYRAQKSYIVNIRKITKINSRSLSINDYEITMSRQISKKLREVFKNLSQL